MNAMSALKWELSWAPPLVLPWAFYLALIPFFGKNLHKSSVLFVMSSSRFGHGGAGAIRVIGKTALESGGLFGLLMGVGGLIRCNDFPLSSLDDNGNDHFVSITAPPFLSSSCRLHVLETAADNFGHLKHLIHATTTGIFSNSSVPSTADVRERQWKNDFMYYVNRKF